MMVMMVMMMVMVMAISSISTIWLNKDHYNDNRNGDDGKRKTSKA